MAFEFGRLWIEVSGCGIVIRWVRGTHGDAGSEATRCRVETARSECADDHTGFALARRPRSYFFFADACEIFVLTATECSRARFHVGLTFPCVNRARWFATQSAKLRGLCSRHFQTDPRVDARPCRFLYVRREVVHSAQLLSRRLRSMKSRVTNSTWDVERNHPHSAPRIHRDVSISRLLCSGRLRSRERK